MALRAEGIPQREIARRIGVSPGTVAGTVHRAEAVGHVEARDRRFTVRSYLFTDLERAARARGVKTSALVERLLTRVVADGLIDAVLDDQS